MNKNIAKNMVSLDSTLKDVLLVLNSGVSGLVMVLDDEGILKGIFTDGDVRRAILSGASLDEPAANYMMTEFRSGHITHSKQENLRLLSETIRHLPILDFDGKPIDMVSWAEIWRLPVMEPSLGGNELKYVADCITSNWISSQGQYVRQFEEAFEEYVGANFAAAVSNGTTAIHLALVGLGVGEGDEVIIPNLTFASPANMVLLCGAKPVFVDIDPHTWLIDVDKIEDAITSRTKAIIPVHLYGHPCDMDPILELAKKYSLSIIEDCAEALGAEYKGQRVGSIGDVGCFSFFANKVITTGEGGMVTANDPELFKRMTIMRDHGMTKERRYWHLFAGFNYRMTNIQAAIGCAQMERIDDFLSYREQVVARYNENLSKIDGVQLPPAEPWAKNIYWLYSIVLDPEKLGGITRDGLMASLAEYGIESRPFFYPLHIQPPYQPVEGNFPISSFVAENGISLPTANDIRLEDVDKVCDAISHILADHLLIKTQLTNIA